MQYSMPLSMLWRQGLDSVFSYMDLEALEKHMFTILSATSAWPEQNCSLCGIIRHSLIGGRTPHSAFKILVNIDESSLCAIPRNSDLAKLIEITDLVICDEVPMQHRHIHEAVNKTFKDIRRCQDKLFGGLTIVFGGDFKQILPVIVKGSHPKIVSACMQRSHAVWTFIKVLKLKQNMHLNTNIEAERNFAKWQLEIGHGKHTDDSGFTTLPDHFKCPENTNKSLI